MYRFVAIVAFFLFVSCSFAQSLPPTVGVDASAMFFENDQNEDVKRSLTTLFKDILSKHDIDRKGEVTVFYFLDAKEVVIDGEPSVLLSIVEGHSLPPAVIEVAAQNDTFYSSLDPKDLPEEGKWVRDYVTRERLKYFYNFSGHVLDVVKKEDMNEFVKTYLENRLKQMKMI